MTRKLSLVTVAVAGALAAAPSALGQGEPFDRELNRSSLTATAPDAVGRAVFAKQVELSAALDARERSLTEKGEAQPAPTGSSDAFTRAVVNGNPASIAPSDAFTRALENRLLPARGPVVDDRFRIGTTGVAVPGAATRGWIEWPAVGLGVGIGIALMLGLGLGLRLVRPRRALAH